MARYPSLYQINTRVWLRELSNSLGRPAALTNIPDAFLDHVAAMGFDYCNDKGLYDRLLSRDAAPVRAHLWADKAYQNRLARFL